MTVVNFFPKLLGNCYEISKVLAFRGGSLLNFSEIIFDEQPP